MKDIIPRVSRELIKKELTKKNFLRPTNKAENEIYDFTAAEAPNLMREVARLREISFRTAGGATGEEMDMDEMDTMEPYPYHQLIVWDPVNDEIVGGYRYLVCRDCRFDENGQPRLTSSHLYRYTDYFIRNYLPYTIELGRAFVQPMYQKREMGNKSLYALDNIWDGIGAVLYNHRDTVRYLIGKVTMYPQYDTLSRNLIYAYLRRFHNDPKGLFYPYNPIDISIEGQELADSVFVGDDPTLNYQLLQRALHARGTSLPPMFSAYLNVTNKLHFFGNTVNDELSDVYETGIMVTVNDIKEDKWTRYVGAYIHYLKHIFSERSVNRTSFLTEEH
ncbi:MAG: GNAT family N-acetyltransferase [Paludibacteraceae bacterium]|nr:GNAT family N-acetyltransferase [Paludibacteraceae bacterium]